MKYIVNNSHNPAYNVALEAYAFRELLAEDELFILWINEPTIVIGKHQNAIEEVLTKLIQMNTVFMWFVVYQVAVRFTMTSII